MAGEESEKSLITKAYYLIRQCVLSVQKNGRSLCRFFEQILVKMNYTNQSNNVKQSSLTQHCEHYAL